MRNSEYIPEGFNINIKSEAQKIEWLRYWNDRSYTIEKSGNSPKIFILGEEHYHPSLRSKQLELIDMVKPDFILHENVNGWVYDPLNKKFQKQSSRIFGENDAYHLNTPHERPGGMDLDDRFIIVAIKKNIPIVGCDLTCKEADKKLKEHSSKQPNKYRYEYRPGFPKIYTAIIDTQSGQRYSHSKLVPEIIEEREAHMIKALQLYEEITKNCLVVILGNLHAENIHKSNTLKDRKLPYFYINQLAGIEKSIRNWQEYRWNK